MASSPPLPHFLEKIFDDLPGELHECKLSPNEFMRDQDKWICGPGVVQYRGSSKNTMAEVSIPFGKNYNTREVAQQFFENFTGRKMAYVHQKEGVRDNEQVQ